jgi:hypothetical protein
MATTYERIDALTDDQVLEAVNLVSGGLFGAKSDEDVRSEIAIVAGVDETGVNASVDSATPREVAELGRVVLVAAIASGRERDVEQALDEIGKKALLLEIAVIGILALGALHLVHSRGRKEEVKEQEITVAPDGTVTVKTKETVRYYTVGESLAPLAEKVVTSALGS